MEGGDIRAVVALICAGLISEGITEIVGLPHLDRGYNNFLDKLIKLGAIIDIK